MNYIRLIPAILIILALSAFSKLNFELGEEIDKFNEVPVYYNGKISNVFGRHISEDGYNLGLKWQCVEFVKRYYYQVKNHKMPSSYGHAKELFDKQLQEVEFNSQRGLVQYKNISRSKPKIEDIVVFDGSEDNPFGHVGIICNVTANEIELIQQNWGSKTRQKFKLAEYKGIYTICDYHVLGWLRKE